MMPRVKFKILFIKSKHVEGVDSVEGYFNSYTRIAISFVNCPRHPRHYRQVIEYIAFFMSRVSIVKVLSRAFVAGNSKRESLIVADYCVRLTHSN